MPERFIAERVVNIPPLTYMAVDGDRILAQRMSRAKAEGFRVGWEKVWGRTIDIVPEWRCTCDPPKNPR